MICIRLSTYQMAVKSTTHFSMEEKGFKSEKLKINYVM
jgi:hypothetical protein